MGAYFGHGVIILLDGVIVPCGFNNWLHGE
jgi:hypothetical protein